MSEPSLSSPRRTAPPAPLLLTPRPPTSSGAASASASATAPAPSAPPSARLHTAASNSSATATATTAAESPLDALLRSYTSAGSASSGGAGFGSGSKSDATLFGTGGASSALSSLTSNYPGLLEQMRHASSLEAKERRARSRVLASGSWKKILTHVIENTARYAQQHQNQNQHAHHGGTHANSAAQGPVSSRRAAAGAAAANTAGATLAAGSVAATLDGARRSLAAGTGTAGSDDVYGLGGGYNPLAKSERLARSHRFGGVLIGGGGGSSGGGNNAGDSGDGGSGGAGSTGGARLLREPDTEDWANWSADDWRSWRECRAREKDRQAKANAASILSAQAAAAAAAAAGQAANGRSSAAGDRSSSALGASPAAAATAAADAAALLYTAASKLKLAREELNLNYDLNPLDHVHTIRHTRTTARQGHGERRGGAGAENAALTKQRTLDARFERDQKTRAAQLYRNIWLQQMKVMRSNRFLALYADKWDRKLSGYKLTLERDAQGNRIRAWHQMDEQERAAVVAAQNGTGGWNIEINAAATADDAADAGHGRGRGGDSGSDEESGEGRSAAAVASSAADFSGSSSDDDDSAGGVGVQSGSGSSSSRRPRRPVAGSHSGGGGRGAAAIHLQSSSNPHKHVYQGAAPSGSISSRSGGRDATTLAELAASTASVAPLASLSARAHASAVAAAHQPQSTFEAMLNAGVKDAANGSGAASISAAQQQQQQAVTAGANSGGGGKNRHSLFHRSILSLKSRHLLLSWEEREQHELKDLFDLLARDRDGYSKMTKASFKAIIQHNFAAAGSAPVGAAWVANSGGAGAGGNQRAGSPSNGSSFAPPPPRPLHLDRVRLDPLLDRIWLAINSAGRSANFLDLADFTQMLGLALQGSLEDRATFAFEIFDLDDDGVLDIHDLFLGLHLGLDELFPRDFRLVAENLYGRMELYEAIWERRQQRVTNHAQRERTRIEAAATKTAASASASTASLEEEQKQPSPASASASASPKNLRLQLSNISDAAAPPPAQPPPRAVSPYVHQELPVLHITKAEFIKLHTQAYVFSVETNRAAAAAATAAQHLQHHPHLHEYPLSARPASGGHHHPHGHAHTAGGHGHGQGQAAFRAATIALHSGTLPPAGPGSLAQFGSASMYVQSSSHSGASGGNHAALPHFMPLHSVDLVEMLAKAFFLPYRKPGGRLGNSPLALAATGGIMGSGPPRETSQHAHAAAMMAAAAAAANNANTAAAAAAREKERTMAAAVGASKGAAAAASDEKSNAAASTSSAPAALAATAAGRGRHHARRSIQSLDDLRSSAVAAESSLTLQSPPMPRPPKAHRTTASIQAQNSGAAADNVLLQPPPSEVDTLLLKLRAASSASPGARISKAVFKRLMLHYLSTGANHQFHELNPSSAQADLAEEERVVDFLFFALDSPEKPGEGGVGRTGTVDGHYAAAMLSFVLRGDSEAQLQFFHRLLDLDKDGLVSARDLCMAHDITNSYCLRTDLRVLLDVFSTKIEQVITHSRTSMGMAGGPLSLGGAGAGASLGTGIGRARQSTGCDVYPDPPAAGNCGDGGAGSRGHSRTSTSTPGAFSRFDHYADPATAAERAPLLNMTLQSSHRAGTNPSVGISLAEFHDALLKFNPSFFLKILRRAPYPREKRTFVAASARHPGQHASRKNKGAAAAAAGGAGGAPGEGAATGAADSAATGAASSSGVGGGGPAESSFDELHQLHRSLMHDLQVSTMIDFSAAFPDAHNAVIGEQILTLRRSLEFQNDTTDETRVFYVASRFLKPPPPLQAVTLAMNNLGLTTGGVLAAAASATPTVAQSMEHAYTSILRLLTRVPQVYVQWTLLQDGSKHSSVETAKFRRAAAKYNLVTKAERQKARYKMVATPGAIYAYGGFPRPKASENVGTGGAGPGGATAEDRADLQHYGTPLRCILLSVTGAQLNEEGLDDLDFLRVDPETGVKYLDQPAFLFELIAQTHMWLQGFVEMVELENSRAANAVAAQASGGGAGAKSKGGESAASAAASSLLASAGLSLSSSPSKPGLLRVVRIGAGNFAAVPGMKEHQGALVAYLLMHAFLINLQRNSVTTTPAPPQPQPLPVQQPASSPRAGAKHRNSSSSMSASAVAAAAAASAAAAAAAAAASQPPPAPVTVSGYRSLSVLEFIFFDEDCCPIPAGPDGRRVCGGVELRFSRRDILELTTAHTNNFHIGILNPTDGFALPGNEEGYTSLASMMGNNTSLRLHQGWHFNVHLLQQANYVPVEMPPIRDTVSQQQHPAHVPYPPPPDADALAADLWGDMAPALVDARSPNPWPIERVPTPIPEPDTEPVVESVAEEEEDELLTLRTDE